MCPIALEKKLVEAKCQNRLPKVVIPVHMGGQSCDMVEINKLSEIYDFKIIEDAYAIGGHYNKSRLVVAGKDVTVFSFYPVKIITTAEGRLLQITKSCWKMALLRAGEARDENKMSVSSDGPWFYQQIETGFNYHDELVLRLASVKFNVLEILLPNGMILRTNMTSFLKISP